MKRKTVWIFNHYATNMFLNEGGRHYWLAENLKRKGYEPVIFCANIQHNSEDKIEIHKGKYSKKILNGITFIFIKTTPYKNNGLERIKNMFSFYKNIFHVTKSFARKYGKPDIILASSVHPLTLIAGVKIAKKYDVPCICEVRDLWPESLVAYGLLKRGNIMTKLMYQGEKWIYKKADSIIMTWEGGKQYILDRGWEKEIDLEKVYYISNGVVLDTFDKNSMDYIINDSDLDDNNYLKIVYTGSIRRVNNLGLLLEVAKEIENKGIKDIKFIIYGSGDEKEELEKRCKTENIENVLFKGRVEKKFVPSILKKSDINILHNTSTSLDKYGQSQNKLFEYLAAGNCIIQTYTTGYSVIEHYNCGLSARIQNKDEVLSTILSLYGDKKKRMLMGENARQAAYSFDYKELTNKLEGIIENLC